jgi:hypothetical protein
MVQWTASFTTYTLELSLGLFVCTLLCWELGRRFGRRRAAVDPKGWQAGTGVIDGAAFGLLGLILGFTFSGAAARLDVRRNFIVDEANAIGTAYLRLDLLPENTQPPLRDAFRRYLDARVAAYAAVPDMERATAELEKANGYQREIWQLAVEAGRSAEGAGRLLLPAINEMIDITTKRTTAAKTHAPVLFFVLIAFLVLASGLLAGYAMAASRERNWLHAVAFAGMLTAVVYVVADMDYPRLGFIRVDSFDAVLAEVRAAME